MVRAHPQFCSNRSCFIVSHTDGLCVGWYQLFRFLTRAISVFILPLLLFSILAKLYPSALLASLNGRNANRELLVTGQLPSSAGQVSTTITSFRVRFLRIGGSFF